MYARASGESLHIQNYAAEVKLRAGELLAEIEKQNGGHATEGRSHAVTEPPPPKLADMGVEKMQSHRWQALEPVAGANVEAIKREGLFGPTPHVEEQEVLRPRLCWTDDSGPHNAMLLEWGSSRLVNAKGYDDPADLWAALSLHKKGLERYLVVGNLENVGTRYAVIAVIWKRADDQMPLFGA